MILQKNECKNCAKKSKDTIKKYKSGKIKLEKAMRTVKNCIEKCGVDHEHWSIGEHKELTGFLGLEKRFLRPYDEGDNSNRTSGFGHNPYSTAKGILFQNTIKPSIRKALQMAEWLIENKYDKDAFIYDDPRLKQLDDYTNDYINAHFAFRKHHLEFMHQIRHIVFFIAKEDPYYTNVLLDFINKFVVEFKDGFELTKKEAEQFEAWHVGTPEQMQKKYTEYRNRPENKH